MLLVVGSDLFFVSRIREVARTLGVPCQSAASLDKALDHAAAAPTPRLVLLDLLLRDADALATVRALRAAPALAQARLIAFAPHVLDELIDAARAAGADEVLTRGQLSKQLPALLAPLAPAT